MLEGSVGGSGTLAIALAVREVTMLVRFYAVGREISGCSEAQFEAASFEELSSALQSRFGPRMARLAEVSTLLLDGARHRIADNVLLSPSDTVDLLPPFAGG